MAFQTTKLQPHSMRRVFTLFICLLVAACSGTNYVFSSYSPQLASRLGIPQTQLSMIGFAGNIGVYSSAPIWGRIVDSLGPRIPLASAFVLLFSGYFGIRTIYQRGATLSSIDHATMYALMLCNFMTGVGGNAGLNGSGNPLVKSFPDHMRATVTGLVMAAFGLSALLFSMVAHVFFPGDTSSFLLTLAIGTAAPMILGFFLIRVVPLTELVAQSGEGVRRVHLPENDISTPLLHEPDRETQDTQPRDIAMQNSHLQPEWSSRALIRNLDFWTLFTLFSILSGTGLMYINNVGTMAQLLYATSADPYSDVEAAKWQSTQVSIVSVASFSGRVMMGVFSDFLKSRLSLPRSYCLVIISCLMWISQVTAATVNTVERLWAVSALLGLSYGGGAAIFPILAIDWFGLAHFSEAMGYVALSPLILGNIFAVMFGKILDAHNQPINELHALNQNMDGNRPPQCLVGKACYIHAFYVTVGACSFAVLVSTWAAWRDRRRLMVRRLDERARIDDSSDSQQSLSVHI